MRFDSPTDEPLELSATVKFMMAAAAFVGADIGGMAAYATRTSRQSKLAAQGFGPWQGSDVWVHFKLGHSVAFTALQPLWPLLFECGASACLGGFCLLVAVLPGIDGQRRLLYGLGALILVCIALALMTDGPPRILLVDLDHHAISGGDFGGPLAIGDIHSLNFRCYDSGRHQTTTCYVTAYAALNRIDLLAIGGWLYFGASSEADDIARATRIFINSDGTTLQ